MDQFRVPCLHIRLRLHLSRPICLLLPCVEFVRVNFAVDRINHRFRPLSAYMSGHMSTQMLLKLFFVDFHAGYPVRYRPVNDNAVFQFPTDNESYSIPCVA